MPTLDGTPATRPARPIAGRERRLLQRVRKRLQDLLPEEHRVALLRATQHSGNRHAPDAIHEHLELTPVCRLLRKRAGATLRLLKGPAQQVHRYTQMVDGRWRATRRR